ncbi:MAG: hypothetical protein AB1722_03240 [Pseudomonadota bacterium]
MNLRQILFLVAATLMLATAIISDTQAAATADVKTPMTQEEYDAYHEQIGDQVEAAARKAEAQRKKKAVADGNRTNKGPASGYGQGYRARQERAGRNGGGGPGR